ncbi:hypothetical protein HZI73_24725 [Vallitalea pronyensis]|uniref:Aminoglycoside phosphotransferase domain-containing protein n=1 Tax=Vallitalea pronyensis TaxID=1348613 RepID=A0A8J8MPF7_9FIRM|nr:hypothetical protein [Vallitalea pronyensis]QUI25306.1 hypothetical protein HZI73_24725 [Vallitalea pronyensis]
MIPNRVLKSFRVDKVGVPLEGGQSTSVKYGDIVIKPIEDEHYYNYSSNIFYHLDNHGYRISRPIKNNQGQFVIDNYGASRYEPGKHDLSRIEDILEVSELLHRDLKGLNIKHVPVFENPWAKAQEVLWRDAKLPHHWDDKVYEIICPMLQQLKKLEVEYQLIHSDLGGNVLFCEGKEPLVIDFSPTFAPLGYADAIIISDNIAWDGLAMSTLKRLNKYKDYKEYIKFAVAFRVLTIAFFECGVERLEEEYNTYKSIWQYATSSSS